MTKLTSRNGPLHIGPGYLLVLISDALRLDRRTMTQLGAASDQDIVARAWWGWRG